MCVLIFSTTFVWNISHSKKKLARYKQKHILVFIWSARYSCQVVMKPEFSRHVFENTQISNCNKKNRPVGAELFHADRRTDRHDEANSGFQQFCERAWKRQTNKENALCVCVCVCVWLRASGWVGGSKGMLWWRRCNLMVKGSGVLRCDAQPLPHSLLHTNWPKSTVSPLIATPVTTQNIERLSQNPMVHRRVHNSSQRIIPILGRIKPFHNFSAVSL
jgi:hypothetical protein